MTGRCYDCGRVVAVIDGHDVMRAKLQRHGNGTGLPCPGSGGGFAPVATSRHGDGAKGTAPCGHVGTYVTARMVLCDFAWCDGAPPRGRRITEPLWTCKHPVRVTTNGTTLCRDCKQVLTRGKP